MAAKPLTTAAIALTEKKMAMTLDDIIKMSKNKKTGKQRMVLNKSQKFSNNFTQDKSSKVRRYMESRSSLRQGALAKRRTNFLGNQFPVTAEIARKAVTTPLRFRVSNRNRVANWNKARFRVPASQRRAASGGFAAKKPLPSPQKQQENVNKMPKQRPQTLDSLFANMKEQRMRVLSRQHNTVQRNGGGNRSNGGGNRRLSWGRGRFGY
ncbi:uncharacterized protein LOC133316395 [Gastrolobium bilobum]|uniref:uncharacterized protein LOC133316395 n=1 Tax=Gastrolobium bilobum TaxID=150636 RepID=UPI002AB2B97E|nr:uncharacterized protein LOC133316395 [Gastrolobium bilobum]